MVIIKGQDERTDAFGTGVLWAKDFRRLVSIHKGTYDAYGWINEIPHVEDMSKDPHRHDTVIFFHRSVWDACQDLIPEDKDDGIWLNVMIAGIKSAEDLKERMNEKPIEFFHEFCKVHTVASRTRRDILSGWSYKGHQDHQSRSFYDLIVKQTAKHLPGKK
jgi:hypothetical protein